MGSETTYLRAASAASRDAPWPVATCLPLHAHWTSGAISRRYRKRCGRSVYLPATLAGKRRDTIRFLPGRHWHEFSDASRAAFTGQAFRISPQSDRMGYRLQGPAGHGATAPDAVGSGLLRHRAGAIRRRSHHPHGRQTTGGYPKIAQIASVDLPTLAQSLPGQELRFQQIELDEAQRLDASERLRPAAGRAGADARSDTIDASGSPHSGPGRPL